MWKAKPVGYPDWMRRELDALDVHGAAYDYADAFARHMCPWEIEDEGVDLEIIDPEGNTHFRHVQMMVSWKVTKPENAR